MQITQKGFTQVELVVMIAIIGILAAVGIPRFVDRSKFDAAEFADVMASTIRYGQSMAVARRGYVCVNFTANTISLTGGQTSACPVSIASAITAKTGFSTTPGNFYFDPAGKPSFTGQLSISVNSAPSPILVEEETGYVHK